MAFQIDWTDAAIADLGEIVSFISRDDPVAAQQVGEDILHSVELLQDFPHLGPTFPRRGKTNVREIVARRAYRIFYRVLEEESLVEVLRVWHTSRDEPPLT